MHYSYFHLYYKEHQEALNREIHTMEIEDFIRKYDIGRSMYNTYFAGKKKVGKLGDLEPDERIILMMEKAKERYDSCIEYSQNKMKKLAWKFRVKQSVIKKLNESYTLSEIEQFEKVDGVIQCKDLIKMKKPGNWRENYCCCMERD